MMVRYLVVAVFIAIIVAYTPFILIAVAAAPPSTEPAGDQRVAALASGDSTARRQAIDAFNADSSPPVVSPALLAAIKAAATDPNPKVTRDLARFIGQQMVWNAKRQDAGAIAVACELATHAD